MARFIEKTRVPPASMSTAAKTMCMDRGPARLAADEACTWAGSNTNAKVVISGACDRWQEEYILGKMLGATIDSEDTAPMYAEGVFTVRPFEERTIQVKLLFVTTACRGLAKEVTLRLAACVRRLEAGGRLYFCDNAMTPAANIDIAQECFTVTSGRRTGRLW